MDQLTHAVEKPLGALGTLSSHVPQVLTLPIFDRDAGQLLIDPSLCAERDINSIFPHQVVDNRKSVSAVPTAIELHSLVLQDTTIFDGSDRFLNGLLGQSILLFTECSLFGFGLSSPLLRHFVFLLSIHS